MPDDFQAMAAPRFLDVHGGKVHVIAEGDAPDRDVIGFLLGDTRTLCGRTISRHLGGLDQRATFATTFADVRLCARCWRAVPEADRGDLFEHPEEPA